MRDTIDNRLFGACFFALGHLPDYIASTFFSPIITPSGEFLSAKAGLGYLITYGSQTFAMTMVVTSIVILCIVSGVLYQIIALAEKKINTSK